MPALQWLGRRWRSASDDYVFSSLMYAFVCLAAGVLTLSQMQSSDDDEDAAQRRLVFRGCAAAPASLTRSFCALGCVDVAAAVVLLLLAVCSARGALFEESRRWPVPYLLTATLLVLLAALVLCAVCTHFALYDAHTWHCSSTSAVHVMRGVVVLNFCACCAYLVSLVLSYDPLGHTAHMTQDEYAQTWWRRLRLLCCQCWKEQHDEDAYKDVAAVFASALRGYDMVLSDIVAGMLLLHGYQLCSQRVLARGVRYPPPSTPHTTEVVSTQARVLRRLGAEQRRVVLDLHRYARFYMAAYGWKLRVYRDCCGTLPRLLYDECAASCATVTRHVCCCCGGDGDEHDDAAAATDMDDSEAAAYHGANARHDDDDHATRACAHRPHRRRAAATRPTARRRDGNNNNNDNNSRSGSTGGGDRYPPHHNPGSNHHRLDLAALLHETGVTRTDVLVASWSNDVFAPVYFAVYDRDSDAVVVCIRGTMSLVDCITDFVTTAATVELKDTHELHTRANTSSNGSSSSSTSTSSSSSSSTDDDAAAAATRRVDDDDNGSTSASASSPYYVHGGMYRSACYVRRSLAYHGVLHSITAGAHASRRVVVLGHSLGAGVAMVLAALLRSEFAVLRGRLSCLAYAPPGAVLSRALMNYCDTFTVGCFLGYDMIPRMSQHTFDTFRESLFDVMAASRVSKARLLTSFFRTEDMARPLHPCSRTAAAAATRGRPQGQRCRGGGGGATARAARESAAYRASLRQHACAVVPESARLYSCKTLVHFRKAVQRTRRRVPWLRGSRGFVVAGGTDDADSRCCFCCGSCVCCCTAHETVYVPCFVDADELQTILVTPTMFHDHFPDKLYAALQRTEARLRDGSLERFYVDDDPPVVDAREAPLSYVPLTDDDDDDGDDEAAAATAGRDEVAVCVAPVDGVVAAAAAAAAPTMTETAAAVRGMCVPATQTTTTTTTTTAAAAVPLADAAGLTTQRVSSYGTVTSDNTSPSSDVGLLNATQ